MVPMSSFLMLHHIGQALLYIVLYTKVLFHFLDRQKVLNYK